MGFEGSEERLQDSVLVKTPSCEKAEGFKASSRPFKENSNNGTVDSAFGQKCDRGSDRSSNSRFLQPLLCDAQERVREVESYSRSQQFGSVLHTKGRIQNGDCRGCERVDRHRRVGRVSRLSGCLFPYVDPSQFKKVPEIYAKWKDLSVQGASNGPLFLSKGVHKADKGDQGICTKAGGGGSSVHRRLVSSCTKPKFSSSAHLLCSKDSRSTGLSCKYQEVGVETDAALCFPRSEVQPRVGNFNFVRGEIHEDTEVVRLFSEATQTDSSELAISDREARVIRESDKVGYASCQTTATRAEETVVSEVGQSPRPSDSTETFTTSPALVVRKRQCVDRSGYEEGRDTGSGSGVHGFIHERLGRYCGWCEDRRRLVCCGDRISHQCVRVAGDKEGHGGLSSHGRGQECDDSHGQFYCCQLHQQAGRNKVSTDVRGNFGFVQLDRVAGDSDEVQTHTRKAQCCGGPTLQNGTGDTNRVVAASSDLQGRVVGLGNSSDRLVCHSVQSQAGSLLLSGSRSESSGGGRVFSELDEPVRLRVPSDGNNGNGAQEDSGGLLQSGSGGTLLAQASVVPIVAQSPRRLADSSARQVVSSEATAVRSLPQCSAETRSSCMAIITGANIKRGFREEVADRIARAQKSSSISLYESKWRGFCDWCVERGTDPLQATVPDVADFLCHLHDVKKLVVSTIRGYVTAINHVFKAIRDLNIGKNEQLIGLISNFERDTSVVREPLPPWDLSVVLSVFRESPYEPMHLVDMKFVTFKTVFLLTLATGCRRSEIHALKFDSIQWQDNGGSVLLFPGMQFLAKTELVSKDILKPVQVCSLTRILGNDDRDRVLCPVRALKFYLKRTEDIRGSRKRLFLAFKKGYKHEICRNTVSGWLKKTVLLNYELASKDTRALYQVKAHQVRAMASSYAFHRNCSMERILMACSWKHSTTFIQFYLRDLTFTDQEGMKKLGPLVVAKQVL